MIALALEGFALAHTEAMLLVDDDDAEALKLHRIFNKRVGADDALDAAVGKSGEDVFFVTLFHLAGEQRNAHAKRRKCALGAGKMLPRENFGGRHERSLVAIGDSGEHGVEGDVGFAAAEVALEQTVHLAGAGHVVENVLNGTLLSAGEFVGQSCHKSVGQKRRLAVGDACLHAVARALSPEGHGEKFVDDEVMVSALGICHALRPVDAAHGVAIAEEIVARGLLRREGLVELAHCGEVGAAAPRF